MCRVLLSVNASSQLTVGLVFPENLTARIFSHRTPSFQAGDCWESGNWVKTKPFWWVTFHVHLVWSVSWSVSEVIKLVVLWKWLADFFEGMCSRRGFIDVQERVCICFSHGITFYKVYTRSVASMFCLFWWKVCRRAQRRRIFFGFLPVWGCNTIVWETRKFCLDLVLRHPVVCQVNHRVLLGTGWSFSQRESKTC